MDAPLHDVPFTTVRLASAGAVPQITVSLHVAFRTCHSSEYRVPDTVAHPADSPADRENFLDAFRGDMPLYTLAVFLIGMFIYTYISLHTVYHRGWVRTFFKTVGLLSLFTFLSLVIAGILLIVLLSSLSEEI